MVIEKGALPVRRLSQKIQKSSWRGILLQREMNVSKKSSFFDTFP